MKGYLRINFLLMFIGNLTIISCQDNTQTINPQPSVETTEVLNASTQRMGNAEKGLDYLVNGNYVDGGIPFGLWLSLRGENSANILKRQGDNTKVGYQYTVITTANNIRAVGANCLNCHASYINNEFVMGLGNSTFDFSTDQTGNINLLDAVLKTNYSINSPEYQAFIPYKRGFLAISPLTTTETQGVNPADKYAAILASHRNPTDLSWRENDPWGLPKEVIPTDVPAWWLLKKKNTMFYTGVGTGDFARIMMASSLVSLQDSSQARKIDQRFPDVLAYIKSLPLPFTKARLTSKKSRKAKQFMK